MSAAVRPHGSQAPAWPISRLVNPLFAAACLLGPAPAAGEVGASVSLFNDARLRGYSLSAGHPVGTLNLSYDDPSGVYGAVSASAVFGNGDDAVEPLGYQLNAGYAKRLPSSVVVDFGVTHSSYSKYGSRGTTSYTEIYAGVSRKALSTRISFAPHYFESGSSTLYAEANANFSPMTKLNLFGHAGVLLPLSYRNDMRVLRTQYDWSLGASRQLGPVSLHAILSGGGPDGDYYHDRYHSKTKLLFGVSCPL